MAMQHHPLSNAALGEYLGVDHYGKETVFQYQNGTVALTCPDSSKWIYKTHLNTEGETEGTMTNPSTTAVTNPPASIEEQAHNTLVNTMHFSKPFGDKPATLHALSVSPRLDQHSIDGMDDMAFNDLLDAMDAAEETIANTIQRANKYYARSEADETSTNAEGQATSDTDAFDFKDYL